MASLHRAGVLVAFGAPLALYAGSLSPAVGRWDTAELQTVPYILGIAHPTGFPVFVGAGFLVSHLFPLGSIAWRISLMSACAAAIAAAQVYRVLRVLSIGPWVALAAAWLYAAGNVVWIRAARAEAHDLLVMFAALALAEAVTFCITGRQRALVAAWWYWGLAVATHGLGVLLGPGLLLLTGPRATALGRRELLTVAGAAVFPLLAYAYLPLRSWYVTSHGLDPTAQLGLPPGQPFWDYGHTADPAKLVTFLTGANSGADVAGGLRGIVQIGAYPRYAARFAALAGMQLGWPAALAALYGLAWLAREHLMLAAGFALAAFACVPFGQSYTGESDVDRYMLTALWACAALTGIGAQRACEGFLRSRAAWVRTLAALVVFACTGAILAANHANVGTRNDPGNTGLIAAVQFSTPDGSVLVSPWVSATSLAYAAYAERTLGSRIVVAGWPFEYAGSYPGWIARGRRVFLVDEPTVAFTNCRLKTVLSTVVEVLPRANAAACTGGT